MTKLRKAGGNWVQRDRFFDRMHEHLRHAGRSEASPEDVEWVYLHEMLSVRGQMDLQHYEGRLEMVLGRAGYPVALEILTEAALNGPLDDEGIGRYRQYFAARGGDRAAGAPSLEDVLRVLRHDGYLEWGGGLRFVSGLLEDWWRGRPGQNFVSVIGPRHHDSGTAR